MFIINMIWAFIKNVWNVEVNGFKNMLSFSFTVDGGELLILALSFCVVFPIIVYLDDKKAQAEYEKNRKK